MPNKKRTLWTTITTSLSPTTLWVNVIAILISSNVLVTRNLDALRSARQQVEVIHLENIPLTAWYAWWPYIFYYTLFVQACVTALDIFGFTSRQGSTVAFFGLPISRKFLFCSRFLVGISLISIIHIAVFVFLLVIYALNIGMTTYLLQGFFFMLLTTLTILFFVYSTTVVICNLLGTIIERVILSAAFLIGIYRATIALTRLLIAFLHGNAMGEIYVGQPITNNAINTIQNILPPNAAIPIISRYGLGFGLWTGQDIPMWINEYFPGWIVVIIWALLACGFCFLGLRLFQGYKTENAGVIGQSRFLQIASGVILSFTVNRDMATLTPGIGLAIVFISISLLSAIFWRLLLTRKFKKIFDKDGLLTYGIITGIYIFIIVIGSSGGFGYSAFLPQQQNIRAARISYHGASEFITGNGTYFGNSLRVNEHQAPMYQFGDHFILRQHNDLVFETQEDIQIVLDLHRQIIDAGVRRTPRNQRRQHIEDPDIVDPDSDFIRLWVRVRYYLHDGSIVERLYNDITVTVALNMLKLDNTDAIQSKIARATDLQQQVAAQGYLPIRITDSTFGNQRYVNDVNQLELLRALQEDINNLTLEEKYFPERAAVAIVHVPRLVEIDGVIGQPIYVFSGMFEMQHRITVVNQSGVVNENISIYQPYSPFVPSERCMHVLQFFITDGYVNTIYFLESRGYLYNSTSYNRISYKNVVSMIAQRHLLMSPVSTIELYFRAVNLSHHLHNDWVGVVIDPIPIPNELHGDLLEVARTNYYTAMGGYRLYVDFADYNNEIRRVMLFIPEVDMLRVTRRWLEI